MSYTYDNASQLTGISYMNGSTNLGSLTYGYDLAGRRTQMGGSYAQIGLPLAINEAEYNANNQLTEWGTAGLYYDANGNMTSDGINSFVWNTRNQLGSMDSSLVSFKYDPYGRRSSKTVSGVSTNYLYDGANIAQEISGGSPIANLLSGGTDEVFTRTDSSGTANFLTNALGSTLTLTDGSGTTLASYAYDPFGNTSVTSGSSTNEFEYTGRENDGTGLYFYRARYYNPTLQRFISEDPAGFVSGAEPYLYTRDEPSDRIDPSGLTDITITVVRQTVSPQSIIGQINVNAGAYGQVNEYSLENASTAISPGSYPAYFRTDSGPGLNHEAVTLYPADGRTNIEIHPGNSPVDSTGCILPGTSTATDWVNHSQAATGKINDLIIETIINDIVNGQPTTITVIVENPPPTLPPSTAGRKK